MHDPLATTSIKESSPRFYRNYAYASKYLENLECFLSTTCIVFFVGNLNFQLYLNVLPLAKKLKNTTLKSP